MGRDGEVFAAGAANRFGASDRSLDWPKLPPSLYPPSAPLQFSVPHLLVGTALLGALFALVKYSLDLSTLIEQYRQSASYVAELEEYGAVVEDENGWLCRLLRVAGYDFCRDPVRVVFSSTTPAGDIDYAVRRLGALAHLRAVSFTERLPGGAQLSLFARQCGLQRLEIREADLSAQHLGAIFSLPVLKHLVLRDCQVASTRQKGLGRLRSLVTLDLSGTNHEALDLSDLARLPHLHTLRLQRTVHWDPVTVDMGRVLLRVLDLSESQLSIDFLLSLATLPQLEEVVLKGVSPLALEDDPGTEPLESTIVVDAAEAQRLAAAARRAALHAPVTEDLLLEWETAIEALQTEKPRLELRVD